MGKRLNKPVYFDDEVDKELLNWLKTKNYSSFMRELAYDAFNQSDLLKVINNLQIQNKGKDNESKAKDKMKNMFKK